jgi:hypothetical protein
MMAIVGDLFRFDHHSSKVGLLLQFFLGANAPPILHE